ncbi:hypothetical protein M407DRAFT_17999 [Tulasnella calospora MUT 4182]|uniref:Ribosome biogenesis protein NOP53 n=1 Tax=Tulasnella calospora MUT 4182 TaxID=1051891 RepID=A0A0C3LGN2_9AGAM|nr:hypothetical protein M407DRAFT_17999 [Tulasnella calospora MUT 4182]
MAAVAKKKFSVTGAPSQYKRTGRKGKGAWRKNVDIDDVEGGMEEIRKEETIIGVPLQKQPDSALFVMDDTGDLQIRKSLPKKLTHAQKILSARSAVPSPNPIQPSPSEENAAKYREKMSRLQRERLQRIAGKNVRGPFNSVVNPRERSREGVGLELKSTIPQDNLWERVDEDTKFIESLKEGDQKDYLPGAVLKPKHKAPEPDQVRQSITLKAVSEPHAGTSYNPAVEAHQDLLRKAVDIEEVREAKRRKVEASKERTVQLSKELEEKGEKAEMAVDMPGDEDFAREEAEANAADELASKRKDPKKKLKRARRAAIKEKLQRHLSHLRAVQRHKLHDVNFHKQIAASVDAGVANRELSAKRRRLKLQRLYANGLAGQRVGSKTKVPKGDIDVQLTEDLAENLRTMKVEGSLFRDRFLNFQQRGLLEARPKDGPRRKAGRGTKLVEKRAWREFDQTM